MIYVTTGQPVSNASQRLAQERKSQLRVIHAARPAADCRSIGHAVRVLERRHRVFPGAVFHKAPSQCLTARQQAVMRVRERKQWEESEGLPANWAATATDANPSVSCACLLRRPWPMIESRSHAGHRRRILSQSLAQSVSSLCGSAESGIKRIVVHWGSATGADPPRSEPEAELLS